VPAAVGTHWSDLYHRVAPGSQIWDITAKVPSTGEGAPNVVGGRPLPPPLSVGLEMLRGLLIDQFEMKTSWIT
jgi:hypothetical protein